MSETRAWRVSIYCVFIVMLFYISSSNPAPPEDFASLGPKPVLYVETTGNVDEISTALIPKCTIKVSQIQTRSGIVGEVHRWSGGINFQLDTKFRKAEGELINNAIQKLSTFLCIDVKIWAKEAEATGDYVYIQRGPKNSGCWSYVGKQGGRQALNLEVACVHTGVVLHELIHAIGFYHEQSRMDRDEYVRVIYHNIIPAYKFAYDKIPSLTFDVPYDYKSIMHYGPSYFSVNRQRTIVAKNGKAVGTKHILTKFDELKMKRMYNC